MTQKRSNCCLIDYLRCSLPNRDFKEVAEGILGLPITEFSEVKGGSPYPTYDSSISFVDIKLHASNSHSNVLVEMAGKACRQYEEYMNRVEGFHWYKLISLILEMKGKVSRIDLALDVFDDLSPTVKVLQDYVKRGQLSSRSYRFVEINSGVISTGKLTGFTLYLGSAPQILRVYDKLRERRDNANEIIDVEKWVRWELELTGGKSLLVAQRIANGDPLSVIMKSILAAHYRFVTQPKNASEMNHKERLSTMRWWEKFVNGVQAIPLNVRREKPTLKETKQWVEHSTVKSISMLYESFKQAYGKEYADVYLKNLVQMGMEKINSADDQARIAQRVLELMSAEEY